MNYYSLSPCSVGDCSVPPGTALWEEKTLAGSSNRFRGSVGTRIIRVAIRRMLQGDSILGKQIIPNEWSREASSFCHQQEAFIQEQGRVCCGGSRTCQLILVMWTLCEVQGRCLAQEEPFSPDELDVTFRMNLPFPFSVISLNLCRCHSGIAHGFLSSSWPQLHVLQWGLGGRPLDSSPSSAINWLGNPEARPLVCLGLGYFAGLRGCTPLPISGPCGSPSLGDSSYPLFITPLGMLSIWITLIF